VREEYEVLVVLAEDLIHDLVAAFVAIYLE